LLGRTPTGPKTCGQLQEEESPCRAANSGEVVSAVICFFETKDPVRAHENSPSKVSKFVAVQDATAADVMPSTVEDMPWRIPPGGTPISSRDAGEFY